MNLKHFIVGVVVFFIVLAIYVSAAAQKPLIPIGTYGIEKNGNGVSACASDVKLCPDGTSVGRISPSCEFAACPALALKWLSAVTSPDPLTGVVSSTVALMVNNKSYNIGLVEGSCVDLDKTNWQLLPNEKTALICWFAGGGTEVAVFDEGGALVVKKAALDEGTAEQPGTRGNNFQTILKLQ